MKKLQASLSSVSFLTMNLSLVSLMVVLGFVGIQNYRVDGKPVNLGVGDDEWFDNRKPPSIRQLRWKLRQFTDKFKACTFILKYIYLLKDHFLSRNGKGQCR